MSNEFATAIAAISAEDCSDAAADLMSELNAIPADDGHRMSLYVMLAATLRATGCPEVHLYLFRELLHAAYELGRRSGAEEP